VLAVCAGIQILGRSFPGPNGDRVEGLGLLGVDTVGGAATRAVGEAVVDAGSPIGALSGFENHAGRTIRDEGVAPLGAVVTGVCNGDGTDGALQGRLVASYLHGPVLARNPAFADWLLALSSDVASLRALATGPAEELHAERLASARRRRR
jgi:CobQ-like glutamine amidotransferase family enzyme